MVPYQSYLNNFSLLGLFNMTAACDISCPFEVSRKFPSLVKSAMSLASKKLMKKQFGMSLPDTVAK